MLSKIILTTSAATMLFAVQALADNSQPPIIKQPAGQGAAQPNEQKAMGNGQGANKKIEMQNNAQGQDGSGTMQMNGQGNEAADQGTLKKKKLKGNEIEQSQDATTKSKPDESQAQSGETNQKLKKKQADQAQQGEEAGQVTKKKADQQSEKNTNENLKTGSTTKAARVEITQQKRTVIRNTIIKDTHVTRINRNDIDVDINVGIVVPHTITLAPLPVAIIDVVPEYRGYDYFVLADGTIVIVDPGSYEIVYVISA